MSSRDDGYWVPSDELSQLFFEGRYETVLERTVGSAGDTHPAVLGALAMVGRLEEAQAIASLPPSDPSPSREAMTRFVLCMGQCHAGRYEDAARTAAGLLLATRRGSDLARFFARQAAAMTRYFTGRMREARRHGLIALAYSWRTGLDYARLIALELNGHVSVQVGELHKGLRALEDAHSLAETLGYTANARTIRLSTLTYALRTTDQRREAATELAARIDSVGGFARRNGLVSLALYHAVAGRISTARDYWEQANRLALRNEDQRGNERAMTLRAFIASLAGELELAGELWSEAERSAREDARSLAEVCYLAALVGRPIDREALDALERRTGLHRARLALHLAGDDDTIPTWLDWPAIGRFPRSRDQLIAHLEAHDALGLLPHSLGLGPAQRIYLAGERWLIEDRGDVSIVEQPARNANLLLEALSGRSRSKGSIFEAIWKQTYNARLHDATLQKLISRCRKSLDARSHWILSTEGGYQLAEGVEVVHLDGGTVRGHASSSPAPESAGGPLAILRQLGSFTSTDLAQRLRVSKATAVRLIRREVADGRLVKQGSGKNTSYRVIDE